MIDEMNDESVLDALSSQGGGLIEIYVFDTTYDDWVRVMEALQRAELVASMVEIGDDTPVEFGPELFDTDEAGYRLTVHLAGETWTTNFFDVGSIDFQGDPREVASAEDLRELVRFMTLIRDATGRRVVLVPETLEPESVEPYLAIS